LFDSGIAIAPEQLMAQRIENLRAKATAKVQLHVTPEEPGSTRGRGFHPRKFLNGSRSHW
jgi:hypothetical protein